MKTWAVVEHQSYTVTVSYVLVWLWKTWSTLGLFKAFWPVCTEGANISGGRCIFVLAELKRQLYNSVRTFQWLSQTFHSNITDTCCSVILMPAASIYTDASACSKLEEKEAQTLEAAIYAKGERQQWLYFSKKTGFMQWN